jgi:hypothetical protein
MAVIIKPKQPFIDWIKSQDQNSEMPEEKHDFKSVYLLAEEDADDWNKYVKKEYLWIFNNELEGWNNDAHTWPINKTWDTFNKWFDFEVQTMIYDLVDDEPIEKD